LCSTVQCSAENVILAAGWQQIIYCAINLDFVQHCAVLYSL
jgi:hypothetical protein